MVIDTCHSVDQFEQSRVGVRVSEQLRTRYDTCHSVVQELITCQHCAPLHVLYQGCKEIQYCVNEFEIFAQVIALPRDLTLDFVHDVLRNNSFMNDESVQQFDGTAGDLMTRVSN